MTVTRSKRLKGVHYRSERERWFAERYYRGHTERGPLRETQWEAVEDRAAMDRAVREGTFFELYGPSAATTLCESIDPYLEYCATEGNVANTLRDKRRHLVVIAEFLDNKRSDHVTKFDVERLRSALRKRVVPGGGLMTGPTANRYMSTFSDLMSYLKDTGATSTNPVKGFKRYKEQRRTAVAPDEAVVASLLEAAHVAPLPWMDVLIVSLFDVGCRIRELLSTPQSAVDLDWCDPRTGERAGMIHPPPSKRGMEIGLALTSQARQTLRRHLDVTPGPWLFPHPKDPQRRCDYGRVRSSFQKIAAAARLPALTMHELRAGCATELAKLGAGEKEVQLMLRDKTAYMADIYVRIDESHTASLASRRDRSRNVHEFRKSAEK